MFWESKGFARAFGIVLLVVGNLSEVFPQIQPFRPILDVLGSVLGVGGVVNAVGAVKRK